MNISPVSAYRFLKYACNGWFFMLKNVIRTILSVIILALLIAGGAFAISKYVREVFPEIILADNPDYVNKDKRNRTIIIDPGHGGEDPGAIGINGAEEKTINLSLSTKIKKLLEFDGYSVIMTRESDEMLLEGDISTGKKARDLRNRLNFGSRYPDAVFVSIHMNKFPAESCRGLQVYYSGNDDASREIAASIRDAVRTTLQPDNHREIKKADSSIFILDNIRIPAVLIECGFISNNDEAALLTDQTYQCELAAVIAGSINVYRTGNEN